MIEPLLEWVVTDHARQRMRARKISARLLRQVLLMPEERAMVRPGREVFQARAEIRGGVYVVRVVVDLDRSPPEIVTAYRTSRIAKYRRTEP